MAMLFSDYSFKSRLNIDINWLLYFMESFDFMNIKYLGEKKKIYDSEYAFTWQHRIDGFNDVLALWYSWAIDLYILDSDYHNDFSTWIDLDSLNEQEWWEIHEDFLYGVYNQYKDKIQQHSQMKIQVNIMPMKFMSIFMKIITQESEVWNYDNEKIIDKLIVKILSKTKGENDFNEELILKYKLINYIDSFPSIFPILVELQNNWHVDLLWVDFVEGYLYFHISKISDIDGINTSEIIKTIWTRKDIDLDFKFDGINIWRQKLSPNLRLFAEFVFVENLWDKKYNWGDIDNHIYGKHMDGDWLVNIIKKMNKILKDEWCDLLLSYERDSHVFIKEPV
jgi:hypothetical protein